VPDWTYIPLKDPAAGLLGSRARAQAAGVRLITTIARLPFGEWVIRGFDYTYDHPETAVQTTDAEFSSPIGVVVSSDDEATQTAFASMGFGFARTADALPPGAQHSTATTPAELLEELDGGATLLIANEATIAQGPATAQRVNEAIAERSHHDNVVEPVQWLQPWTWPAWVWAFWLGVALRAQLMMVMLAVGVFLSGFFIMSIGLRDVLIPSDLVFLGDDQEVFASALDGRLLRFIAHDRAGFGGALASLGGGLLTTTLWGWRPGERSTWWMLLAASTVGFGAALAVHVVVGYTDFFHLMPVYLGIVWVSAILYLSSDWFRSE